MTFPAEEFMARRQQIFAAIGTACALVQSGRAPRGYVIPRQTNEFFYCCGLETPHAYLLLDGTTGRSMLYLPERGSAQLAEGAAPGLEDAVLVQQLTGVDAVHDLGALATHLAEAKVIYTPHAPAEVTGGTRYDLEAADRMITGDPWDGQLTREEHLIEQLRLRIAGVDVRDLTPILDELRSVKSPREVAAMRRAGRLCALAVREAMAITRPGIYEYQLGALASYIYRVHGCPGEGYRAIIAGGPNIWQIHYFRNNRALQDGELVLMDVAPEWSYYTSDIGRMWPVNGVYSPQQRELYGFIVEYLKVLLSRLRPGVMPDQVMDEAAQAMEPIWAEWPFSQASYREGARRTLAFRGHLSHPVGMAVHDDGPYDHRPLAPGTVFAVDPQMWIPEEQLYIRVEDTVVITEDGYENLTVEAPLELDDVEAHMARAGQELPYLGLLGL